MIPLSCELSEKMDACTAHQTTSLPIRVIVNKESWLLRENSLCGAHVDQVVRPVESRDRAKKMAVKTRRSKWCQSVMNPGPLLELEGVEGGLIFVEKYRERQKGCSQ